MDIELNDAIARKAATWRAYTNTKRGTRAHERARLVYTDAEDKVKALMRYRNYDAAYVENDLRDKIPQALLAAQDAAITYSIDSQDSNWDAVMETTKTYADLRAELLRMNPGAM